MTQTIRGPVLNAMMKVVMLTFDIEEFDMPGEYGRQISFEDQIAISKEGTLKVLDILQRYTIPATFFCTGNFAKHSPETIQQIVEQSHEIASHGYFHSQFEVNHLKLSKIELERISAQTIEGFRMARMMPVENGDLIEAGYLYNSSLNPVLLPGRYNNLSKPRTLFRTKRLVQVPASATPLFRIPLFWLSFHNMPLWLYKLLCTQTINRDNYLNLYFHPWEFTQLSKDSQNLPGYVCRNSGSKMVDRFAALVEWMNKCGFTFMTMGDFVKFKNGQSKHSKKV